MKYTQVLYIEKQESYSISKIPNFILSHPLVTMMAGLLSKVFTNAEHMQFWLATRAFWKMFKEIIWVENKILMC